MKKALSKNQIRRLPDYLTYLTKIDEEGNKYVSALQIANALNLNSEKVKKDIQQISSTVGVPNKGREIKLLIEDIQNILGYNENHRAILVGCGQLGRALLNYSGFENLSLKIVGAFDHNPKLIGRVINDIIVYNIDDLVEVRRKLNASIGIICVPKKEAQGVAIRLVASGVEAIWNFAPTKIDVNDDVIVSNMDMAQSLASLAHRLYINKNFKGEN